MTGTEEPPEAADTPGSLGARAARAERLPRGRGHVQWWIMTRPRAAPSRTPLGPEPGLSEEAEDSAPADRGRPGDRGCGHGPAAAASTPPRSVALGEVARAAGRAGVDTGAGRVPYPGWPGIPQAADAGRRAARDGAKNAGYTSGPPASWGARDSLGAAGATCSARGRRDPPGGDDGPSRRDGESVPGSRAPGLAQRPGAGRSPPTPG